ncbi:NAD(P)/FAD-dependent oxidoreductase [Nonomuraea muscovyensis]
MTAGQRVVVVGASLAGVNAVHGLRAAGFAGRVSVVGAEPHVPYDRPPLSKQSLLGTEPRALDVHDDAEWLLGRRAMSVDLASRVVELDGGAGLGFDGLVIATGAEAVRPPWRDVVALRTLDDCRALRAALDGGAGHVVVVGAGFVGAEVAASCRAQGVAVTVADELDLPLARSCGPLVGEVLAALHREHGARLELGVKVAAVHEGGRAGRHEVELADGRVLAADVVVAGLGACPATGWLSGSGLALDDGVLCDETLLAAPGVVAAGDVCRRPSRAFGTSLRVEHWTNAVEQGEYAGRRLHAALSGGPAPEPFDAVPYLWTEQYGHTVQMFGCPEPGDEIHVVHGDPAARRFAAVHVRGGVVRAVTGMDCPARVRRLRPLVAGAQRWTTSATGTETTCWNR